MFWKEQWKPLAVMLVVFVACFWLPVGVARFDDSVLEALHLVKWYAQEHVLLCLVPAFFIAGAISVFVSQASVLKYLGPQANKAVAYAVASCSGTILAVCSCTILPLFAGIYRRGAGLGPASAFLYSGPAINILAIFLTARILGAEIGIARAVGAVLFSVVIGLAMHWIYRKEETEKAEGMAAMPIPETRHTLGQDVVYFASMVGILVFANWGRPAESEGLWAMIYTWRWWTAGAFGLLLGMALVRWFDLPLSRVAGVGGVVTLLALVVPHLPLVPFVAGVVGLSAIISVREDETGEWFRASWDFAKQILPLLLYGVLVSGMLLGRPGGEGLLPSAWVAAAVGGNSFLANFTASFLGAFMYFATLTEIPIVQGLLGSGMGKGPALALLLAGPALSLPSMLVIRSVMGTQKTVVYVSLVVVMATLTGMLFGGIAG
ncbi:permease family protein [Desulfovibrio sp. A2]|nr:permease family protein [Desulfovibrio sp. A2]